MALHGQIQVNGHVIGGWSAQRREFLVPADRPNTYECTAHLNESARATAFVIEHHYGSGALALAAAVLAEADRLLNPKENADDH
jgi:hypothetical protein